MDPFLRAGGRAGGTHVHLTRFKDDSRGRGVGQFAGLPDQRVEEVDGVVMSDGLRERRGERAGGRALVGFGSVFLFDGEVGWGTHVDAHMPINPSYNASKNPVRN